MAARTKITDEQKREALATFATGKKSAKQLGNELGVSEAAVYYWRKNGIGEAKAAPEKAEKASKKTKRKRTKSASPKPAEDRPVEAPTDVIALIEDAQLPFSLGKVVEACFELAAEDDFAALERAEGALARHRASMESRAALDTSEAA